MGDEYREIESCKDAMTKEVKREMKLIREHMSLVIFSLHFHHQPAQLSTREKTVYSPACISEKNDALISSI